MSIFIRKSCCVQPVNWTLRNCKQRVKHGIAVRQYARVVNNAKSRNGKTNKCQEIRRWDLRLQCQCADLTSLWNVSRVGCFLNVRGDLTINIGRTRWFGLIHNFTRIFSREPDCSVVSEWGLPIWHRFFATNTQYTACSQLTNNQNYCMVECPDAELLCFLNVASRRVGAKIHNAAIIEKNWDD